MIVPTEQQAVSPRRSRDGRLRPADTARPTIRRRFDDSGSLALDSIFLDQVLLGFPARAVSCPSRRWCKARNADSRDVSAVDTDHRAEQIHSYFYAVFRTEPGLPTANSGSSSPCHACQALAERRTPFKLLNLLQTARWPRASS